jgi:hypothetical protein
MSEIKIKQVFFAEPPDVFKYNGEEIFEYATMVHRLGDGVLAVDASLLVEYKDLERVITLTIDFKRKRDGFTLTKLKVMFPARRKWWMYASRVFRQIKMFSEIEKCLKRKVA